MKEIPKMYSLEERLRIEEKMRVGREQRQAEKRERERMEETIAAIEGAKVLRFVLDLNAANRLKPTPLAQLDMSWVREPVPVIDQAHESSNLT
jgi:hypothetical protein